jgi:K+-sensing histidine kinase KdpD
MEKEREMRINESFLTPAATFVATIISVLILGVIDWVSGYDFQFFVFYLIPIAIAAWTAGPIRAYLVALLSAIVWFAADEFSGHPYTHLGYLFWNTAIRLVSFLIVAYAVARIRWLLTEERKISDDLREALAQTKTLRGLLPICASCKKIRNDKGYWQKIEEYVEKHSNAQFTHGLCQECAAKLLKDAGIEEDLPEPKSTYSPGVNP